jgi:aspartate 1-decarboxylase
MLRILCKSKIHRATISDVNLHYEGSISIDERLLAAADIMPNETVQVVNVNNGNRFETYAICGAAGSGTICLNGAAARLGHAGDEIIIITYAEYDDEEARSHHPSIVLVDAQNRARDVITGPSEPSDDFCLNC